MAAGGFSAAVWALARRVPPGRATTYGLLAECQRFEQDKQRRPMAARAVGQAMGHNPVPIIIPCHRVLAKAGLGGYSGDGGLATKQRLLTLEAALG